MTVELPDRFRVTGHVARGGMASIWAAEDLLLGRQVAIKVLATQFLSDANAVRRFQREARAAASLSSHPNVVTIFDVGEHRGRPFIVMEYMSGGSVADVMRGGRRPPHRDVMRWLDQAAGALDAAHQSGVVHRDVKPGNLLLDDKGRLGVTDFGIARLAFDTPVTSTGEVLGTAAYLAPEQAEGDAGTPASDRYALAVVAYELLTGSRPFRGESFAAQAHQHVKSDPVPPSRRVAGELPRGVDAALLRGLEKKPEDRWPSAQALVEALRTALMGEGATVAIGGTAPTEALAPRRTRAVPPPAPPPPPRTPVGASRRPPRQPSPRRPVAAPARAGPRSAPARERRWTPVVALVAAVAVLGAVLGLTLGGGGGPAPAPSQRTRTAPSHTTSTSSATPPQPTGPAPTQPSPADGRSVAQLNDEGFRLINARQPDQAIPLLRRAVGMCGSSTELTCAYAMFNLGHALRLAGRPKEAIPILERRLQIPNQQDVVRQELDSARREAGQG
ncbi:MAG: protein kinase domain-containing protein [Solirubrobacteraceae bacterium]